MAQSRLTRLARPLTTSARLVSRRNTPPPTVYVDTGLVVAAVGRPNVGKSTLFNALGASVRGRGSLGRDHPASFVFVRSVVDAEPGVTRDPRTTSAAVGDLKFTVIDTPGLERPLSRRALKDDAEVNAGKFLRPPGPLPSVVSATALCEDAHYRALYDAMEVATVKAVKEADIAMLVLDASEGVTPLDESIADWLRTEFAPGGDVSKRLLVVANKCDKRAAEEGTVDAFRLGLGEPIAVSGEHRLGFGDLYNYMNDAYKMKKAYEQVTAGLGVVEVDRHWSIPTALEDVAETDPGVAAEAVDDIVPVDAAGATQIGALEPTGALEPPAPVEEAEDNPFDDELVVGNLPTKGEEPLTHLVVSIIGRPNVGKSTLLNRLVDSEASLVGPASGVTRDAVLCKWEPQTRNAVRSDIPVSLIDTAGIRHEARVRRDGLERLSVRSSIRALRHSHVVMVILDATDPLNWQDIKLIELAIAEGRAIVLVVNKWDKVGQERRTQFRASLKVEMKNTLHAIPGVEVVEISAGEWKNGDVQAGKLFGAVHRARERWEKRVSTSALNRFMQKFNERALIGGTAHGARRNRRGVAKFISQKKIRPPMFRIDGAAAVSQNYLRQLSNELRKEFGFQGVPIRIKRPSRRGR